jgi:hypothetical protein
MSQNGPGERRKKVGRCKRDVRGRRRTVVKREASGRVRVQDTLFTRLNNRGKEVPPGIRRVPRGEPTWVVGIEIAKYESVVIWEIEQSRKVRLMTCRTG